MTTIKFRRDTSTNWTQANPIPAQGEPCYETDTGKLKIGNGSDYYSNLPYVSDGGSSGGTTDYTELENKPQINSVELSGNKTLDELGIQAKGDYLKTSQVSTTKNTTYGVYLQDGMLQTAQPVFDAVGSGLATRYEYPLKLAVYAATEPDNDDMVTAWTDKNGFFTGSFSSGTGYIYGSVKFVAGEGSIPVIYKMMDENRIGSISQTGTSKFSKVEISSDGSSYKEVTSYPTSYCRYIRFTFDYNFSTTTYASFNTKICTYGGSSIGGIALKPLGVNVDNSTIKIVDDKLVGNITSNMIDATYMKINDDGKLSVDTAAVAHLAMPSTTSVTLTLGATGTSYTAPADGWVVFDKRCGVTSTTSYQYANIQTNDAFYLENSATVNNQVVSISVPVYKGQGFYVNYSLTGETLVFRFIYTVGSVPSS